MSAGARGGLGGADDATGGGVGEPGAAFDSARLVSSGRSWFGAGGRGDRSTW